MQDKLSFMKNCLNALSLRGWDDSQITMQAEITAEGNVWTEDYFYIYPRYTDESGVLQKVDSLYVPAYNLETSENKDAFAARLLAATPPIKEHKTKLLLEHVAKISELAAALNLSADFINPITALADLIRTNILPAPSGFAPVESDDLPF